METKKTRQESAPKGDPSTNRSPLASVCVCATVHVGVGLDKIVWPNGKREKQAVCGGPTLLAVFAANFHSFSLLHDCGGEDFLVAPRQRSNAEPHPGEPPTEDVIQSTFSKKGF